LIESKKSGGEGGRTLLLVHGRDFKPCADDFMDLSINALSAALLRDCPDVLDEFHALNQRIAYYGDLTEEFLSGQGQQYDEVLDMGDRRNALIRLKAIDKKKNFGIYRYDRLPGKTALGEFAADVIGPVLGSIGFSKQLIAKVGIDLSEYWNDESNFAARVRDRVRAALCAALEADQHVLLISHGTGCIVAYDVLWELSHDAEYAGVCQGRKIDMWLTLGAPLGDAIVQKRLRGANQKGTRRYPSNIVSWHNVSAEDDFVSHDNTLADDFRQMLKQKQVSCIRDYHIYNMAVRYGKSDPHCSLGYLIHPKTAQIMSEWLQQRPVAQLPKSIL
jgi:hypothetical protein